MSNLKSQQEKLLSNEITRKVMEYMMGLDEKNEPRIRKKIKKASKEMVKLYSDAIKRQHKKILKSKKKKDHKVLTWHEEVNITDHGIVINKVPIEYTEVTPSMAS